MNILGHFTVPYKGMGNGVHNLEFNIDDEFFKSFEASHLNNGKFKVLVELDKRHDSSVISFDIDGSTLTNCDRCLESIHLPMYGDYILHVKHSAEGESNDEIMYIHPETSKLDLSQVIYEFILLSMPIIKSYDCENDEDPPCNFELLNKLNNSNDSEENSKSDNSIWDSLKNLELDNKENNG